MEGNRAIRRFKELRSQKSAAVQMSQLTEREQEFLRTVAYNPGSKLNGGEADDERRESMWPLLENLGLIECIGSYKWKATERGISVLFMLRRRKA